MEGENPNPLPSKCDRCESNGNRGAKASFCQIVGVCVCCLKDYYPDYNRSINSIHWYNVMSTWAEGQDPKVYQAASRDTTFSRYNPHISVFVKFVHPYAHFSCIRQKFRFVTDKKALWQQDNLVQIYELHHDLPSNVRPATIKIGIWG